MSPLFRLVFLAAAWILWLAPFFLRRLAGKMSAVKIDTRARWGIILAGLGFGVVFLHSPVQWGSRWSRWRVAAALATSLGGIALSWSAVRALGKQWRVDAGLNADHQLVREGPYRIIRHPIYASMLCMLLTGIAAIGTLPGAPLGLLLFIAGTEIRVRVEDGLLLGRFQDRFVEWRRRVPAYIPFLR